MNPNRLVAALLFVFGATPAHGDFIVDSGLMSSICSNTNGLADEYYSQIQNPFNPPPLVAARHNSIATAAFMFNWSVATGHFRIDADLASEGGDGGPFCGTDNRVNFHVTQQTLLSIDSEWTYQFSGGIRTSTIRFWVRNLDTANFVLIRGDTADTVAGDPSTDTLYVSDSILLPPGNYYVRALMDLRAVGGSANSISTAHGFANIQMTTVPAPAALGPLALAALLIRKRASRKPA